MLLIARRTALAAALLLVMPLTVWLSGWLWQPWTAGCHVEKPVVGDGNGDPTVGNYHSCRALRLVPLVSALSAARGVDPVPYPCRRYPSAGQGGEILGSRRGSEEPRPFVIWLENTRQVPVTQFYALKRKERAKLVHEQLAQAQDIPSFLRKHWQKETGFAFPSGHTMFAASWALLAAGLLWPRRRWGTIAVLLVWATAVMGSRLGAGHALAAGSHRRHADLPGCWSRWPAG